jgi:hypothetical protein
MVHPVIVGTGKRLFSNVSTTTLRLVDSQTTGTGVAVLTYRRAPEAPDHSGVIVR